MIQNIAREIVACSMALEANTVAVQVFLNTERSVNSIEFQQLWDEREKVFQKWTFASRQLQFLPKDEALEAIKEIQRLRSS